jgi:DNA-binding transcriptional ArsR family regulator
MNDYTFAEIVSIAGPLKALANENRLLILHWLADPERFFPPQVDGDLVQDGVCVGFITEKIGLKQPTVTNHMKILQDAGFVRSKRIKNWVFYQLIRGKVASCLEDVSQLAKT